MGLGELDLQEVLTEVREEEEAEVMVQEAQEEVLQEAQAQQEQFKQQSLHFLLQI